MALVIVIMTMTLLTALGTALTLATLTETAIAANYRVATETLYAAEAGVEFVVQEVARASDWNDIVADAGQSAFVDGPAEGTRTVGAVTLDLTQATRDTNSIAATSDVASPPHVLHAFGRFQDLVPSSGSGSPIYVAVWVGDRSEAFGDEGVPAALSILGQAYGSHGSRRAIEVIVAKVDSSAAIRTLSWREIR